MIKCGEEEALKLGYTLFSSDGQGGSTTYLKRDLGIFLTVFKNGGAELQASWMLVQLKLGLFSFPNKNFSVFEKQMTKILTLIAYNT